ncbi:hypothetical protein L596_018392 [Steinernema carpocapsae]|uniref:RUN domain-containing protein n=1 Tax=Steinernema carpocapsae TaxID=34508 RepID=A0A4U5N4U6_STECR|nr:hypothetical protein L596_018392 [Steinernema carpocapsae]
MSASQTGTDVLWIRIALQEKLLSIIMDFIKSSHHCRRFYEKDALIVDPVKGGMIAAMMGESSWPLSRAVLARNLIWRVARGF